MRRAIQNSTDSGAQPIPMLNRFCNPSAIGLPFLVVAIFASIATADADDHPPSGLADTPSARYRFVPHENGTTRYDLQSGTIDECQRAAAQWVCTIGTSDRTAYMEEIKRLRQRLKRAEEDLARRIGGEIDDKSANGDAAERSDQSPPIAIPQSQIEQAIAAMDRVFAVLRNAIRAFGEEETP